MKKKIIVTSVCLLVFVCGCKDEEQKFREKVSATITSYMEGSIEGYKVDSVSILDVDSLTHLDYAHFRKVVLTNHEKEILSHPLLYLEPQTDQEYEMQEDMQSSLRNIQKQLIECDNILANPTTDTVTVHYFLIAATVYGKQGDKTQQQTIGFPIDKDFNVQEIDLGHK